MIAVDWPSCEFRNWFAKTAKWRLYATYGRGFASSTGFCRPYNPSLAPWIAVDKTNTTRALPNSPRIKNLTILHDVASGLQISFKSTASSRYRWITGELVLYSRQARDSTDSSQSTRFLMSLLGQMDMRALTVCIPGRLKIFISISRKYHL